MSDPDRVQIVSRKADGSPDQREGFEDLGVDTPHPAAETAEAGAAPETTDARPARRSRRRRT